MYRTPVALAVLASLFALLPGCKTVGRGLDRAETAAAGVVLPPSEEKKLGVQVQGEVEKKSKLYSGSEVVAYVNQVGQRVVSASPNPDKWRFTFKVIDDPKTVNAFAIPGATIYVYTGLLKAAKDEAALAGVLAHEVAHVTSRHIAKRLVETYGMQALASMALGKDPGAVAQIGASLVMQGALLKYSRDDESQADSKGVVATSHAGYDPRAMIEFFEVLKAQEGKAPALMAFLSDHPATTERIQALNNHIREQRLNGTERNATVYAAMREKL